MSKHTPGPWATREGSFEGQIEVYPVFDGAPDFGEWAPICIIEDNYGDDLDDGPQEFSETVPNARLISAAPELIDCITEVRAAFIVAYEEDGRVLAISHDNDALRRVVLLLDAAIRKTEGRQ